MSLSLVLGFLTNGFQFLARNWLLVVVSAVVVSLGVQTYRINRLHHDLAVAHDQTAAARVQVAQAAHSIEGLRAGINQQNQQVDLLHQQMTQQLQHSQTELVQVRQRMATDSANMIAQLRAAQPPPGVDRCVAANDLITLTVTGGIHQ